MADVLQWIMISVVALMIIAALLVFVIRKKKGKVKEDIDYRAFFYIGLMWTLISVPMMIIEGFSTFFILGLVFLAIGGANKDKWKKEPITKNREFILIVAAVGVVLLAAIAAYVRVAGS